MHIEPGIVAGAKMLLSYGTVAVAGGLTLRHAETMFRESGLLSLVSRALIATLLVFSFFEVLPHHPVGVSEVHFIFGSTLFLLFGAAPAALGLAGGLLLQGFLFAPWDLPMYAVNATTLLLPLFAMAAVAKRVIPENVAYKDLSYSQVLQLSVVYQGGVVAWVAFWAFYGQGFGAENLASVGSFGVAYLSVILLEPVLDLGVLAVAKLLDGQQNSPLLAPRLFHAAS